MEQLLALAREAFDAELAGFVTGKGSVRLAYGRPVPGALLRQMIAFRVRVREHGDDGACCGCDGRHGRLRHRVRRHGPCPTAAYGLDALGK